MKQIAFASFFIIVLLMGVVPNAKAEEFSTWIDALIKEAIQNGVRPQTAYNALSIVTYDPSVIEKDKKQPENNITINEYWKKIITPQRIQRAKNFYSANRVMLNQVGDTYGVNPRYIVALLSIESQFGEVQGNTNIIQSLASLAYEGRRRDFFKSELFNALKIIDKRHITQEEMVGSWAGAMGWCQFMPSSFLKFGVDFDGDGRINIWSSATDAAASAANYLQQSGWNNDETWGRQVRLTSPIAKEYLGREVKRPISEWKEMGIKTLQGKALPDKKNLEASLIMPDGEEGTAFLVYNNFDVIMQWNKSSYFATSIGIIADKLAGK